MRKIRDVLRLRASGMSKRQIAASLSIGPTAAGDCMRRARYAGLSWPLPEDLSDEALERLLYTRVPRLFADLELAHGDGRFTRLFRTLVKTDLLILDDWGPDRLTANQRRDLMEIVEDRYGRGSTLITSQLPIDKWHDVIGEPTFADAILDRIVHNAHRLDLDGPSMRKIKAAEATEPTAPAAATTAANGKLAKGAKK
jgi:hypothetical protein